MIEFTPSAALARGKNVVYIWSALTEGRISSKYERFGVTAMPPFTSDPPPTPRPWYTRVAANCSESRTPAEEGMFRLMSSPSKWLTGWSVRVRNQYDRPSGFRVLVKILPSEPGVVQLWPISMTWV